MAISNEAICSVCGVRREDEAFYVHHGRTKITPDDLKARVCQYAKKQGCINSKGNADLGRGWMLDDIQLNNDR